MTTPSNSPFVNTTFSPYGIQQVAGRLLEDPAFAGDERRAKAMAIAYFASGAHDDGQHDYANKLHAAYRSFHHGFTEENRHIWSDSRQDYLTTILDMATLWDRFTTGVTWILHSDATRRPGASVDPTEATVHVYAPPSIINSVPSAPFALARSVQLFVEGAVLDAMTRWDTLTNKRVWSKAGPPADPRPPPPSLLPSSTSTHFVFRGRPAGTLDPLIDHYLATRTAYVWSVYAPPPSVEPARCPPVATPPGAAKSIAEPATIPPPTVTPPASPPMFVPPPTAVPSSRAQGKAPAPPSPPLRSVFGNDGDPFAKADMEELLQKHTFESFDHADQLQSLQDEIRFLNINLAEQHALLEASKEEINLLHRENHSLKEHNAKLLSELLDKRLAGIAKPSLHGSRAYQLDVEGASGIDELNAHHDIASSSTISSVSSVSTSLHSHARMDVSSRATTPGTAVLTGFSPSVRSPSPYAPSQARIRSSDHLVDATMSSSMTMQSGVQFQIVNPIASPSGHRRITAFGPATRQVFETHNVDASCHRTLWYIEDNILDDQWPSAVRQFCGISDAVVVNAIVQAMMADSSL
ncbi:hypothetical protein FKP32DRAFT_1681073 [Trametes sanguinea]|nr:hypothetical protein FKP32DRAFT_1681073 [Trametes sanguinea]